MFEHMWAIPASVAVVCLGLAAIPQEGIVSDVSRNATAGMSEIVSPMLGEPEFSHGKAQPWNRCDVPVQVNLDNAPEGFLLFAEEAIREVNTVSWVRYGPVTATGRGAYTPTLTNVDDTVLIAPDPHLSEGRIAETRTGYRDGLAVSAVIAYNPDVVNTLPVSGPGSVKDLIVHEMLHVVGVGHAKTSFSIMSPNLDGATGITDDAARAAHNVGLRPKNC